MNLIFSKRSVNEVKILWNLWIILCSINILLIHFPIIPGHEYAGIVAEVGAQVKDYKISDRLKDNV